MRRRRRKKTAYCALEKGSILRIPAPQAEVANTSLAKPKSMSMAISHDYGLSWSDLGQIITGTDQPTPNRNTGEGDGTVADLRPTTASDCGGSTRIRD
jgi:hypothetical protein